MPAFCSAPFMAMAPSCTAVSEDRLPPKLPMGVRTAETIYTSFIWVGWFYVWLLCCRLPIRFVAVLGFAGFAFVLLQVLHLLVLHGLQNHLRLIFADLHLLKLVGELLFALLFLLLAF